MAGFQNPRLESSSLVILGNMSCESLLYSRLDIYFMRRILKNYPPATCPHYVFPSTVQLLLFCISVQLLLYPPAWTAGGQTWGNSTFSWLEASAAMKPQSVSGSPRRREDAIVLVFFHVIFQFLILLDFQ